MAGDRPAVQGSVMYRRSSRRSQGRNVTRGARALLDDDHAEQLARPVEDARGGRELIDGAARPSVVDTLQVAIGDDGTETQSRRTGAHPESRRSLTPAEGYLGKSRCVMYVDTTL